MTATFDFTTLIETTASHPEADFYRNLWGEERAFDSLPTVSRADFLRIPLSRRRYKTEKALVKVVHDQGGGMFLSEWAFSDIAKEPYGIVSARPIVFLSNSHETLEKAMWCYGNGVVPLAGEKDPDIAMYAADKYRVNSMITDQESLLKFERFLRTHERLETVSVIGTEFDFNALMPFRSYTDRLRLVLALPETGAFAEAELSPRPAFKALPGCVIQRDETLVVSKHAALITPVIRYKTSIPETLYDGS